MARSSVVLRRVFVAAAVVIAASVAVPTSATAAPDIAGTWRSVDREGVPQTLTILHSSTQKEYRVLGESPKFAPCGGMEAAASGVGTMSEDGRSLMVAFQVQCMVNRAPVCDFAAETAYSFDAENSMLFDEFQSVWHRTSTPAQAG